jgi:3-carboxy-cis,cis-muconate cycloisomerase
MAETGDWGLLEPLTHGSHAAAITGDDAYLDALVAVEAALARAWAQVPGTPSVVGEVASSLTASTLDREDLRAGNRSGGNPVIPLVPQLRAAADDAADGGGDWVHRGATSQDILDTASIAVAAHSVDHIAQRLSAIAALLAARAADHSDTLMVARTLSQHASPTTFGAVAASWLDGVDAAIEDLVALTFPVQLGGSVGTGAAFDALSGSPGTLDVLRAALAVELDLDDPARAWHTERSPIARIAAAAAFAASTAGRIAADLVVLARTEIAEVSEGAPDGAGSSSAMPQKRNPATAVLIVGAARRAPGLLATLQSAVIAEDQRPAGAWHSEWQALRELLRIGIETADALHQLVGRLEVDTEQMLVNLAMSNGLVNSENVLAQLSPQLGQREASALVSAAAERTREFGVPFGDAVQEALAEHPGVSADTSPAFVLDAAQTVVDAALERHERVIDPYYTEEPV